MQRRIRLFVQLLMILVAMVLLGHSLSYADERPQVRLIHAATGLSNIDIYINDILFFDNIIYQYISAYVPVDAGERAIKINPAGVSPEGSPLLGGISDTFNNDENYTIIVAGRVGKIEYWRLTDDNKLPGDGTSKVRIVHVSINTPSTEFCLGDVCRTLTFKEPPDYFLLDPGVYQPKIRLNGVAATSINIPPLELKNNSVHTVFMVGQLQDQPTALDLLYTIDAGEHQNIQYPQPLLAAPPSVGQPLGPPPALPPVTGAFLSPRAIGVLIGIVLILLGSLGFWLSRR